MVVSRVARRTSCLELLGSLASAWSEVLPSEIVRASAERALAVHPLRGADALQLAAALTATPAALVSNRGRRSTPVPLAMECVPQFKEIEHGYPEMIAGWRARLRSPRTLPGCEGNGPGDRARDRGKLAVSGAGRFIDADAPSAGLEIVHAVDEGLPVVLVSGDGSTRILRPEVAAQQIAG